MLVGARVSECVVRTPRASVCMHVCARVRSCAYFPRLLNNRSICCCIITSSIFSLENYLCVPYLWVIKS